MPTKDDEQPWEECSVCEYNQTLKAGGDGVLRFVEHTRDKAYKGKIGQIGCDGSYRTPDETREMRRTESPRRDPSQRPL